MFLSRGLTILRHCKKFSACQKSFYSLNNNLIISSICISHPCIVQFPRCKSSKRNVKSLLPYRIANENCEEDLHSQDGKDNIETHLHDKFRVLLNPDKHADIINAGGTEAPADSKSLQVSVVGIPNAGKSTLVNQLIGSNICPHSQKVHTTRENTHGILTKDSIQVIFQDTPGIITEGEKTKFGLSESLLSGPYKSCIATDLILVVHDVSNRYVRENISKRVLSVLCRNPDTPAILVLNKLDTIPKSRRVYDLIRKLTCGRLNGIKQGTRIAKGQTKKLSVEEYFIKREKSLEKSNNENGSPSDNRKVIASYDDLLAVLYENKGQDNEVYSNTIEELTKGLVGWPGFQDVFTVSALHGDGVIDLRDYLMEKAYPSYGHWKYDKNLLTNKDPRKLVIDILKSKFLDVLPHDVPYNIEPVIETWSNDGGFLKLLASVTSNVPRTTNLLLNDNASNLSKVAKLAERDLQNLFHCEVFVLITVNVTHKRTLAPRAEPLRNYTNELDSFLS